jgi:uncharacterized protein (DUF1697 family)
VFAKGRTGVVMTIYIALLRGINVGGHNLIKMQDLRNLLTSSGLENVQTYIQSGNIIFQSEKNAEEVQTIIADGIKNKYGFSISVMVRTVTEWEEIMKNCPYSTDTLPDGECVHLIFLSKEISNEEGNRLRENQNETEECFIAGKEIYLHLRKSILDSRISNQLQKFSVPVTARNWKTISKLEAMVSKYY